MSRKKRILNNKQQQANKQNAQHSTGPKTEEGKAASSRNSFRHGLTASAITALPGEDIQDYIDLANGLRAHYNPTTIIEDALVTKMIQSLWLSKRAVDLQQRLLLRTPEPNQKHFELFMRYQNMHDRAYSRSFAELQKLRKEAVQQDAGFVSEKKKEEVRIAKIHGMNVRTASVEFNMSLQKTRSAQVLPPASTVVVPQHRDVAS